MWNFPLMVSKQIASILVFLLPIFFLLSLFNSLSSLFLSLLSSSLPHSSLNPFICSMSCFLHYHLVPHSPFSTSTSYNTDILKLVPYIRNEMHMSKECELEILIVCGIVYCVLVGCNPPMPVAAIPCKLFQSENWTVSVCIYHYPLYQCQNFSAIRSDLQGLESCSYCYRLCTLGA